MRRCTSLKGLNLLIHFEKFVGTPYLDSGNVWTIGYGHTFFHNGKQLTSDISRSSLIRYFPFAEKITKDEALNLLKKDVIHYENIVNSFVNVPLTQNQFDALVSHSYNTGGSKTLFRLVNEKASKSEIYNWFTQHYITVKGRKLRGLVIRRRMEADLFFS